MFASLFLLISGVLSYQKTGNVLVCIVLVPIVGYFLYYLVLLIMRKEPLPNAQKSKTVNKIIFIIFVALTSGSLYTIVTNPAQKKVPIKSQWVHTTPTVQIQEQKHGTIKAENDAHVRIREKASIDSEIIDTAEDGETFDILDDAEEWVRVQLNASQSGWINKEFITISKKE